MFDQLDLPLDLSQYLISISPILGISGDVNDYQLHVITQYFALSNNMILINIEKEHIPEELTLNLLRKGEDEILIAAFNQSTIEKKYLQQGKKIKTPHYLHSILSFETKVFKKLEKINKQSLAIYEVLYVNGVAGLDPTFNDRVTLAKTLEVMALSAVDKYVIEKKISNK